MTRELRYTAGVRDGRNGVDKGWKDKNYRAGIAVGQADFAAFLRGRSDHDDLAIVPSESQFLKAVV